MYMYMPKRVYRNETLSILGGICSVCLCNFLEGLVEFGTDRHIHVHVIDMITGWKRNTVRSEQIKSNSAVPLVRSMFMVGYIYIYIYW